MSSVTFPAVPPTPTLVNLDVSSEEMVSSSEDKVSSSEDKVSSSKNDKEKHLPEPLFGKVPVVSQPSHRKYSYYSGTADPITRLHSNDGQGSP